MFLLGGSFYTCWFNLDRLHVPGNLSILLNLLTYICIIILSYFFLNRHFEEDLESQEILVNETWISYVWSALSQAYTAFPILQIPWLLGQHTRKVVLAYSLELWTQKWMWSLIGKDFCLAIVKTFCPPFPPLMPSFVFSRPSFFFFFCHDEFGLSSHLCVYLFSFSYFFAFISLSVYVYMCMCVGVDVCTHSTLVEVSSLLPCRFPGSKSFYQVWWQVPFPTEHLTTPSVTIVSLFLLWIFQIV